MLTLGSVGQEAMVLIKVIYLRLLKTVRVRLVRRPVRRPWAVDIILSSSQLCLFQLKSIKLCASKVEMILKGSLNLIPSPSPSMKIQIMDGKVYSRCTGKTLLGLVNKLLKTKSLLTSPSTQCFALLPQVNWYPINTLTDSVVRIWMSQN